MTKSTKNKKTIYNYLDKDRYNIELSCKNKIIYLIDYKNRLLMNLTQQNAKDLIPILNEFAETGELKLMITILNTVSFGLRLCLSGAKYHLLILSETY
jgi:hypothetical protein